MSIGSSIAFFRSRKNITQSDLAEAVGVNQSIIANIERERKNPSVLLLKDIASALDVTPNELLGVDNNERR